MEEVNVFHCFTTDGAKFLLRTYHLLYELGAFSNSKKPVVLPLCDIDSVTKHSQVLSNTLVITTIRSQELKFKFKSKKILQTVYDLLEFRIQDIKVSRFTIQNTFPLISFFRNQLNQH